MLTGEVSGSAAGVSVDGGARLGKKLIARDGTMVDSNGRDVGLAVATVLVGELVLVLVRADVQQHDGRAVCATAVGDTMGEPDCRDGMIVAALVGVSDGKPVDGTALGVLVGAAVGVHDGGRVVSPFGGTTFGELVGTAVREQEDGSPVLETEFGLGAMVGTPDGRAVGPLLGVLVGAMVGEQVGRAVGPLDGTLLGGTVGAIVKEQDGRPVGGSELGEHVGAMVGRQVGRAVGPFGGTLLGVLVGAIVGEPDGRPVDGSELGELVGTAVREQEDGSAVDETEFGLGAMVGEQDGRAVGPLLGVLVGAIVGQPDGRPVDGTALGVLVVAAAVGEQEGRAVGPLVGTLLGGIVGATMREQDVGEAVVGTVLGVFMGDGTVLEVLMGASEEKKVGRAVDPLDGTMLGDIVVTTVG